MSSFWRITPFILIICLAFALIAGCSSNSLSDLEVESTIDAEVNKRLTETTVAPDLEATVNAQVDFRLTETAPTAEPMPVASVDTKSDEQAKSPTIKINIGSIISAIISTALAVGGTLWATISKYGIIAQVVACLTPIIAGALAFLRQ